MQPNNTTSCEGNQEPEILIDKTVHGRINNWQGLKCDSLMLAYYSRILDLLKAERIEQCGSRLEFLRKPNGEQRLYRAYFCKDKLCPMCNWRRSLKLTYQTQQIVGEFIKRKPKARFLFLTLTLKNVDTGKALDQSLKEMTKGFNRLFKYKAIDKHLLGFLRVTELTVSKKDKSYNQHMHVLMAVSSTYFKKENYISQSEWRTYWQKAMKLDYLPQAKINAVKPNKKGDDGINAAVKETAKYTVKSNDFLSHEHDENLKIVSDLSAGLYRKRMISYGKMFKEIHAELHLSDAEEGDMIRLNDNKEKEDFSDAEIIVAQWSYKKENYYIRNEVKPIAL